LTGCKQLDFGGKDVAANHHGGRTSNNSIDGDNMQALLKFSNLIDALNRFIGKYVIWLILASTVISALNAVIRKAFNFSSNSFLEVQWYLFAATFMLCAGFTLLNGEHVKIDVLYSRWSKRAQTWIDVFGFTFFLLPFCSAILWFSVPFFLKGFHSGEMSSNAGGLIRWPVYAMMPLGFGLLWLQGSSELIKRVAFLMSLIDDPTEKVLGKTAEEELAEAIQKLAEEKAAQSKAA
jgi:TRAP-type mannitol/chloroaromatic compound transport system permease small subunit